MATFIGKHRKSYTLSMLSQLARGFSQEGKVDKCKKLKLQKSRMSRELGVVGVNY